MNATLRALPVTRNLSFGFDLPVPLWRVKKGKIQEAQELYEAVLQAFPKNKRAQQGLAALNKTKQLAASQGPPQDTINQLINLYNQRQLGAVVEQAKALTLQYPDEIGRAHV